MRPLITVLTGALHASRQEGEGLSEVARSEVCLAGAIVGLALKLLITTLDGNREGALAHLDGLKVLARYVPKPRADVGQNMPQARTIAESGRQVFGFTHHDENVLISPEWYEGKPQL